MIELVFTVTIRTDLGETDAERLARQLIGLPDALVETTREFIREETVYSFGQDYDLLVKAERLP